MKFCVHTTFVMEITRWEEKLYFTAFWGEHKCFGGKKLQNCRILLASHTFFHHHLPLFLPLCVQISDRCHHLETIRLYLYSYSVNLFTLLCDKKVLSTKKYGSMVSQNADKTCNSKVVMYLVEPSWFKIITCIDFIVISRSHAVYFNNRRLFIKVQNAGPSFRYI